MNTPATGYSLEAVHTVRASYGIEPDPGASLDAEREISFLWDWHVNSTTEFAVVLGAKIGPSDTERDELEAIVVGTFELLGEMQSVDLRVHRKFGVDQPAVELGLVHVLEVSGDVLVLRGHRPIEVLSGKPTDTLLDVVLIEIQSRRTVPRALQQLVVPARHLLLHVGEWVSRRVWGWHRPW